MSSFDASNQRREQVTGGLKFVYEPHRETEIDGGGLEPTRLAIPVVPAGFDASKETSPKVPVGDFYVDEEGRLRLPSVDSSASPALIENAVDALQQWRFKPPTIKGKGVLVYAVRVVKFRTEPPALPTHPELARTPQLTHAFQVPSSGDHFDVLGIDLLFVARASCYLKTRSAQTVQSLVSVGPVPV